MPVSIVHYEVVSKSYHSISNVNGSRPFSVHNFIYRIHTRITLNSIALFESHIQGLQARLKFKNYYLTNFSKLKRKEYTHVIKNLC